MSQPRPIRHFILLPGYSGPGNDNHDTDEESPPSSATPLAHAASHERTGTDAVHVDRLGTHVSIPSDRALCSNGQGGTRWVSMPPMGVHERTFASNLPAVRAAVPQVLSSFVVDAPSAAYLDTGALVARLIVHVDESAQFGWRLWDTRRRVQVGHDSDAITLTDEGDSIHHLRFEAGTLRTFFPLWCEIHAWCINGAAVQCLSLRVTFEL